MNNRQVIDIALESSNILDEVVVTAMGIKRSEKAIGFAAAQVSGSDISEARTSDVMSSLSGKIAGVKITTSSSDPGASNSVVIRGYSSLSGSNQPLYVIDGVPMNNSQAGSSDYLNSGTDFGNGANAINPDDVESMTILKGAAATALYGSRAANGVILITSKSGKKQNKGIGVEYNGGVQFESILRFPEMQNEFGIGWSGDYTMIENGSWGPRLDGSKQLWGTVYNNSQKLKSFVALPNNIKDFFDTGFRYSNSVSFNGATDVSDYYVSFSQLSNDGSLPGKYDTFDRYTFSTRGSYKVKYLTLSSSLNYANQKNEFSMTGQGLTMINSLYQIPRDISIIGLKDLNDPFNTLDYYFTPYGVANPYYVLEVTKNTYKSDRLYGKVQADIQILKNLVATYRFGLDFTSYESKSGTPEIVGTPGTPNEGQIDQEGKVSVSFLRRYEMNHDFLLNYDTKFGEDFTLNALAGANINERAASSLSAGVTGLDIYTWYDLSNSANTPVISESASMRRLYGVFAQVDFSFKDLAFITATARNDWSSTLPKGNNSFFYPGVTGSFVFSDLLPKSKAFTYGKLRVAWGQTGNDASPYLINPSYVQSGASVYFGELNFPLQGTNAFTLSNRLGSNTLQPEITSEFEVGTSLAFLDGRIKLDASYYNRNSDKQIFTLSMDPSTGFTSQVVNLGKIQNQGVEAMLNITPIHTKDFKWDVYANFTKNYSKVISLPEELGGETTLYGLTGGFSLKAVVGEPLGVFYNQVPERDPNGNIVVNPSNGQPVPAEEYAKIGDINYDYELGLGTSVSYKGLSLSVDFDIRQGGIMYSRTKDINYFVGNPIQTAYNDRNTFIIPGSVNKVGDGQYVENTTPISSASIYEYWGNGGSDLDSGFLIDKSFVKLRQAVLTYTIPSKVFNNSSFFRGIAVSLYGNNLFLWTPSTNTFIDPELTTFGNDLTGQVGEYTANPSTRKFGINVTLKF